jgi:hypothetical protein
MHILNARESIQTDGNKAVESAASGLERRGRKGSHRTRTDLLRPVPSSSYGKQAHGAATTHDTSIFASTDPGRPVETIARASPETTMALPCTKDPASSHALSLCESVNKSLSTRTRWHSYRSPRPAIRIVQPQSDGCDLSSKPARIDPAERGATMETSAHLAACSCRHTAPPHHHPSSAAALPPNQTNPDTPPRVLLSTVPPSLPQPHTPTTSLTPPQLLPL